MLNGIQFFIYLLQTKRTRISTPQALNLGTENIQPGSTPQNQDEEEVKTGAKCDKLNISPIKSNTGKNFYVGLYVTNAGNLVC